VKSFLPSTRKKSKSLATKSTCEAPHYKARQALYLAFFSPKLYVDVVKRWRGIGAFYFFIMISVMALPFAFQSMGAFGRAIDEYILLPINSLPPFTIHGGHVFFHGPMPYLIKNNHGDVISIIDTEGHINQLPTLDYPFASILITDSDVHINFKSFNAFSPNKISRTEQYEQEETVFPLHREYNNDFFAAEWLDSIHVNALKNTLVFSLYPISVMFNFSFYLIACLAIASFAKFIAKRTLKTTLSFQQTIRLILVAATPLTFCFFSILLFGKGVAGKGLILLALLAVYFSCGALAYRRANLVEAGQ